MPKDTKKVPDPKTNPKTKLWDLAVVFTKLGAIAFGRPAAHIAAMLVVWELAIAYVEYQTIPVVVWLLPVRISQNSITAFSLVPERSR